MADVRSLLKNERAARRVQHKHASYSTGTLLCTVCHLQVKSEALWEPHLKSPGHLIRLQKLEDSLKADSAAASNGDGGKRKRKASDGEDTIRKRTKAANGLPDGFFDDGVEPEAEAEVEPTPIQAPPANEIQIPSRPATPSKPVEAAPKRPSVDEDEWAAFEADIAAAEVPTNTYDDGVISAPAMSAAELAAKDKEEDNKRKRERQEAELEGDKEDAARKLEEEFEEMESLEQRVKRLREKREALRKGPVQAVVPSAEDTVPAGEDDEDDEDDDDDDDWDGFRMKG